MISRISIKKLLTVLIITSIPSAYAIMKPESSMLLINEADGGGSINVQNMEKQEALLYVKIIDLPDDPQPKLLVTQPVMRVGAEQIQRVRFILKSNGPLESEHLKRAIFEGIGPKNSQGENEISINIRHNIPVIIHPKGLPAMADPWKQLIWTKADNVLIAKNPGKYVVRLSQNIKLLPSGQSATAEKSYILPGQTISIKVKDLNALKDIKKVAIETLSKYGYEAGTVEMPVTY